MIGRSESFTKGQQHAHGQCIEDIGEFVSQYRSIIITTVTSHIMHVTNPQPLFATKAQSNALHGSKMQQAT
jgi:hypothetical protein